MAAPRPAAISSRERKSLLLGAAVFLLGGIDAYLTGDYLVGGASVAMALFNVLALALLQRSPDVVQLALFLLNAATALLMAYSTFAAGKQWLPYAWMLAAVVFVVAGWRKHGRAAALTATSAAGRTQADDETR